MKILLTTLNSKFIHTNLAIRYIKESIKDLIDVDLREYTINNQLDYILKDIAPENLSVADYNKDGKIDVKDSSAIQKSLLNP